MTALTHKAAKFLEANKRSPVVYGSVTGPQGAPTGCYYRLENEERFELSSAELRSMPAPRWALEDVA